MPFAAYVALQFTQLQTYIASKAVDALEEEINGNIEVGRVAIVFFNKAIIYDVSLTGSPGDTLASFRKLSVTISPRDLLRKRINIHRVFMEDGCFNLKIEGPVRTTNIKRILGLKETPDSLKKPFRLPDMTVGELTLRNIRFNMSNEISDTAGVIPGKLNFSHLAIDSIDARFHRIQVKDNTVECRIRDISCRDSSGYRVQTLSGNFFLRPSVIGIENLSVSDNYSDIIAHYLTFGFQTGKDVNDFVNRIVLGADFDNARLDFRSLAFYASALKDNSANFRITGKVDGPVCHLKSSNLHIEFEDSTKASLGVEIEGLPDFYNTSFQFQFHELISTMPEISAIASHFSRKPNSIGRIIPQTLFTLEGSAGGNTNDMVLDARIHSSIGSADCYAHLSDVFQELSVHTSLKAGNLDLGAILKNPTFGETDFSTGLKAQFHKDDKGITATLDSLKISRVGINGYDYKGIYLSGEMKDHLANIRVISHDHAVPAMFQSIVRMGKNNIPDQIRIFLDVPFSDLKATNLIKKGDIANLGITASANLRMNDGSILGNILLDNINYSNDNGSYHVDSLYIRSAIMQDRNIVTIKSPIFNADYSSTDTPARLINRIKHAVQGQALAPVLQADTSSSGRENGYYDLHLRTFDMTQICNIILPGLTIADSTTVDFTLRTDNSMHFNLNSSEISYSVDGADGYHIKGLNFLANTADNILSSRMRIDKARIAGMNMDNWSMNVLEVQDNLRIGLAFHNADSTRLNLTAKASFMRDDAGRLHSRINLDPSDIKLRGHSWNIAPTSVRFAPKYYAIDGFRLSSDVDELRISGVISEDAASRLSVDVRNIDLSVINSFIAGNLDLRGYLSGNIVLSNFFTGLGAAVEVDAQDLGIFGEDLGTLSILSRRDTGKNRFNILINNYISDLNPLNISGYYIPDRNYINLRTTLEDFQLSPLSSIFREYLTISAGSINGSVDISGQPDKLVLLSNNTYISGLELTPQYTQVKYTISGPVTLTQNSIELNNLEVLDRNSSLARLNGSLTHRHFQNIYLDGTLNFNNFLCLNTRERDNDTFYGTAYASGQINISGYTDNLVVDAQVTTNDNSSIHIPLSSASSASNTELISFSDFRQASTVSSGQNGSGQTDQAKTSRSNIQIHANAGITQGVELLIEMDKELGTGLRCTGSGDLDVTINPARDLMDIRGDYTIAEGSYHFAVSIQSRDFIIDEGGTIAFNGDFRNTNLNVGATYRTKASISTLISDTTSVGNRRNVNCGIKLQGPLSNPELSFSIDIPDLDPITKGRVESALSTPDKIQKQFLALLLSGSFTPDEQSGIFNNSTILYSNASEIISNQVNNIFRQLDIPLDLGLNYQPGVATGGRDMFDVAISYQAFNNRLIINGNLGNSETSTNWAGDFDAEIKVDRQGKLRVTVFTRSADSYSNYLDNTQRSGFGITYQDEFNTFGDLWRNIFYSRKRKEEYELQLMREAELELEKEAAEANITKEDVQKPKEDPMNFIMEDTGYTEYSE